MLIALLISAALPSDVPRQLGYPIFVRIEDDRCAYGIQDMIMNDPAQITDWIRRLPFVLRVDIVTNANSPSGCIKKAESAVHDAGYSNIVVRRGSEADYGYLGPPRP